MTKQEARDRLERFKPYLADDEQKECYQIAIEALDNVIYEHCSHCEGVPVQCVDCEHTNLIDKNELKRMVEYEMDMQELYLPCHFFEIIDSCD